MATAVSTWSPVIMIGRMPARRHSSIASFTSGRTGSIMPHRPRKQSSHSKAAGSQLAGRSGQRRSAAASTRSARSAMALLAHRISARSSSLIGTTEPPRSRWVQRASSTSGAPFVYCTQPAFARCTVLIILRIESKGASPQRAKLALSLFLSSPSFQAQATSAASVGSPVTAPASSTSASQHSAIACAARRSSSP